VTGIDFENFVGIDWSGAKNEFQRGIQIAEFYKGDAHPLMKRTSSGQDWSRPSVFEFIASLKGSRTLIGIDFAFSVPWTDSDGSPFSCTEDFSSVYELWSYVDEFCNDEQFFYAGRVWRAPESPFRDFIWCASHCGQRGREDFFRKTERMARSRGLNPKSVYRMVGPQVGAGSFAGMRLLHALRSLGRIAVWPFEAIDAAEIVLVEVYPSALYHDAKCRRPTRNHSNSEFSAIVGKTLRHFGFDSGGAIPGRSIDAADAFVSCAALGHLAKQSEITVIPGDFRNEISKEGWIFGIPFECLA
jgi:hypothetical protein